jgi:alkylhydroperoxidase family enzyme
VLTGRQVDQETALARIPYRTRSDAGDDFGIYDRLERERKIPTPNVFLALAHAPVQLDGLLTYAKSLRSAVELGKELRELAILSMSYARGGGYISAHHEEDAIQAGITTEQLAVLREQSDPAPAFSALQSAVIELGRNVGHGRSVTQEQWDAAAKHLDHKQMIQLTMTICWYMQGEIMTQILDLDTEADYQPRLPGARA